MPKSWYTGNKAEQIDELIIDAHITSINHKTPLTEDNIFHFVKTYLPQFKVTKKNILESKNFNKLKAKGGIYYGGYEGLLE